MLKLSYTNTENNFAIPNEKYVIKTKSSPDLKIMTYLGNGEFKRDLFGFEIPGLQKLKLKPNDTTERYIVPLKAIIDDKSSKDFMKKEETTKKDKKGNTICKYVEDYSYFLNAIRKDFNRLAKNPAEFEDDNLDKIEIKSDKTELFDLLDIQLELSTKFSKQNYYAQFM